MKILCLHGYGQHEQSMKSTFSGIDKMLYQQYKAELHFVMGPHQVTNFKKEQGYAWFTVGSDDLEAFFGAKKYYGIEESVSKIKQYIQDNGPFDGIIGFSQGSVLTTILLGMNIHSFKFAFIIGSYSPTDPEYILYDKITIPTLHIWGLDDSIVMSDRSEKNYNNYPENKQKYIHDGKHIIPSNSISKMVYKQFSDKYMFARE